MKRLSSSVQKFGTLLDRVGNRYAALLSGAAGFGAAKHVMDFEQRLTQLGIQAGISSIEVEKLKKHLFETAQAPDIRLAPEALTSAVEKIVEKTGDLSLAQENLGNIGRVMRATSAAGADVGAMVADLQVKFGLKQKEEFLAAMDTLVSQGKAGAFTLQNLAAQGERVSAAYAAMGRRGPEAVREMGALLQMAKMGTGSAEQAATAFERLMAEIVTKSRKIEGHGIQVWDEEALKKGQRIVRAVPDIVKDIITRSRGDAKKLRSLFGDESIRALTAAAIEFQKTGGFASLDKYLSVSAKGDTILKDSARAAGTAAAAMTNLRSAWKAFADAQLSGPIQKAADALNQLGPERTGQIVKGLTAAGGVLGALALGRKAQTLWSSLRKRPGSGSLSSALASPDSPLPVYVVNLQGLSSFAGAGGRSRKRFKRFGPRNLLRGGRRLLLRGGILGKILRGGPRNLLRGGRRLLRRGGKFLGPATLALTAMEAIDLFNDRRKTSQDKVKGIAKLGGSLAGGLVGAEAGAALGTLIFPGVGTLIGGALGGLGGSLAGESAIEKLTSMLNDKPDKPAEVQGRIAISFSGAPSGMRVQELSADGGLDLELDNGPMRLF